MPIECRKCVYFKVTWEKNFPYMCKAFGFKSLSMPSIEVYKSAGRECLKYSPKPDSKTTDLKK